MRNSRDSRKSIPNLFLFVLITLLFLGLYSCKSDKKKDEKPVAAEKPEAVITVTTTNMNFDLPDTIPSGWNTFRYINKSPQTHFFSIEKYPIGKTLDTVKKVVFPPFDEGMRLLNEGKNDEAMAEFGKLPKWMSDVVIMGGTGLLSPGEAAETTTYVEPGHYFIECYVKMSNGVFHSSMGMFKDLNVSEKNSEMDAPEADYSITISKDKGIEMHDTVKPGLREFSVFFKDQTVYGNFAGHDVNLARINESTDIDGLNSWMNWVDPKGLIEPAPENVIFLGGVNNMPAGSKAYFRADLTPGKYVLIAEVPDPMSKNMLKEFEVRP